MSGVTSDELLAVLAPLVDPEPPAMRAFLDSREALGVSARYYASIGWPVIPLVAGGKVPVTANGCKDASTDADTVAEWWRTMPSANIGVATGVLFDVIDVDAPDGFDSYARFRDTLTVPHPPLLAVARTGSGGVHVFIEPQPGARNGANFMPGLDYRAGGGYVLVAPSRLVDGARYVWTLPPDDRLGAQR